MKGETDKKRSRTPEELRELYDDMPLGGLLFFLRVRGLKLHDRTGISAALEFAWLFPAFLFFILVSALCGITSDLISVLANLLIKMPYLRPSPVSIVNKSPGASLLWLAQCLYSPNTIEKTFEPLIADWRVEYLEALEQGHILKARGVSVRYTYSFIVAMGASKVYSFLRRLTSAGR